MAAVLKKHRATLVAAAAAALIAGTVGHAAAEGSPYRVPVVPQSCLSALHAADDAIADRGPILTQYVIQRDACRAKGGEWS